LKPANVLLDQDHKPRLADFGQSRLSHEQTPALGTLFYMAPEQADLDAVPDSRWDVYALGALLYCMLTGDPPYRNETTLTELDSAADLAERLHRYRHKIRSAPAVTLHRSVPGVDRALADIIERCLAIDPEDRYANVQGVLDALDVREETRARRPLVTLGFVGPALLMLVMVLAGYNGYRNAVDSANHGVDVKAVESNRFAAQFVAQAVAHQLDEYFRAAHTVAQDQEFQRLVAQTVRDEQLAPLLEKLDDPTLDKAQREALRPKFVEHAARQALQQRMTEILKDREHPPAASWFVNGPQGTQLASAFHSPPAKSPIGRYYGYRTYFTGLPEDLGKTERPSRHVHKTHLSAIFKSTATNTWKVAISTPVVLDGEFVGVLAITADVGSFMDFGGQDMQFSDDRFAVLVDGRPGDSCGAILQHPLFDKLLSADGVSQLPERLGDVEKYGVKLHDIRDENQHEVLTYEDPLAKDEEGTAYDKQWIAAKAKVKLLTRGRRTTADAAETDTGLVVLVQEDRAKARRPVEQLGLQLVWIGVVAIGAVVLVVTVQWYFVVRLLGHRSRAAADRSARRSGLTPVYSQTTIASPRRDERR
jgi:hypothetical protein